MNKKGINFNSKSKLSDFVTKKTQLLEAEKKIDNNSGLVTKKNPVAKVKAFRFTIQDLSDLHKIRDTINNLDDIYRLYNDTDVLRGMINMIASSLDTKKLLSHIKKIQ